MSCKSCKFWKANPSSIDGTCKRYPPKALLHREQGTFQYDQIQPSTPPDDFCGEYAMSDEVVTASIMEAYA